MKFNLLLLLATLTIINGKHLRFLIDYEKAAQMLGDAEKMKKLMEMAGKGGYMGVMGHIGMVIEMYHSIATTFSTTVVDVIKGLRAPAGFKAFQGSVVYDFTLGFRELGYDFFVEDLLTYTKVPSAFEETFTNTLEESAYIDKNCLSDFNLAFKRKDDTNTTIVQYVNAMIYHYRDWNKNKFDAIITTAECSAALMDFEFIWNRSKSVAGGITQESRDYSQYVSRDMTDIDVQNILLFFQVASYKELAKIFGVDFSIVF